MFENLGQMMSNAGSWVKKDPEQFAIMADMVGGNLDPDNAFAGVGTALGKSSLANKQAQRQQDERKALTQLVARALGGVESQTSTPSNSVGPLRDGYKFSGPEEPGPTQMTLKSGKNGEQIRTVTETLDSPQAKQPKGFNMTDLVNFSNALSGNNSAGSMMGLSPAEISQIVQNDQSLGQLGNQSWKTITGGLYQNAAAQAVKSRAEALSNYRNMLTKKAQLDAQLAEEQVPLMKEKLEAERDKVLQQVRKLEAEIQGQRLKNAPEQLRNSLLSRLIQQPDIKEEDLPLGLKAVLYKNTLAQRQGNLTTDKRLEEENKFQRAREGVEAFARISDSESIATPADINLAMETLPDDFNYGAIVVDGEAQSFKLPLDDSGRQMTLGRIREIARKRGVPVGQVLQYIYEKLAEGDAL